MRLFLATLALAVTAGCTCGPGKACATSADCSGGLVCETLGGTSGYCVLPGGAGGGSGGGGGNTGDAGFPKAVIANATIDFGGVGCGKPAVFQMLDLKNDGDGPYSYTATLTGSTAFSLNATAIGTVAGGTTTKLSVGAAQLASATAGVPQTGTLTITTSDPARAKVEVPLKLTAAGVTLTLNPQIASFGTVPVGMQAPAVPLTLTNGGTLAATLTLAQPADTQFSLAWDAGTGAVTVEPGASVPGLSAGFKPTANSPLSSSAALSVLEAVCGQGVTSIPFTGQGTSGNVGISTGDVFFGNGGKVSCGTQAPSKTFVLSNSGNNTFGWTATLGKGASSPFTVMPSGGNLLMGSMVTLTVSTTAIPAQASTAAEAFGDTLTITTDVANDSPHPIALHQTASGAILLFQPSAVDFGFVPIHNTANAPLGIVNDGNAPATVALTSSNPSFSVGPAALTVVGGVPGMVTGTFAPGTSVAVQNANVAMSVDAGEVLCAPLPPPMTMTGQGTNGSVSYTPVLLDFGNVNCGTTAAPKTVTFKNDGNQSYTITPTLAAGAASAFTVSMSPDSGVVVQDGGTVLITVTPKAVPFPSQVTPNLYGDTLSVATDVSGDQLHSIPLRETAQGSIFQLSTGSINFGGVAVGVTASSQFTVSNNGNLAGSLTLTPGGTTFGLPSPIAVPASAAAVKDATFTPTGQMTFSDTAVVGKTAATVLCAPLPGSMMLAGTGTAVPLVVLSSTSLTFGAAGLVPCNTTATAKTFTVTNNSSGTLTMTYTLMKGAPSPYTVSGPATLAASAMGTVTVTPKLVPAVSSTAPDAFGDTLTVQGIGGLVNESHAVALHETAQGAILVVNPTSLSFPPNKSFNVINNGNLAAAYTLTVGGAQAGDWSVAPTSGNVAGGGNVQEDVSYSRALLPLGAHSGNISLSSSVVTCGPLPGNIGLTGN